jgi:hypothetical protein
MTCAAKDEAKAAIVDFLQGKELALHNQLGIETLGEVGKHGLLILNIVVDLYDDLLRDQLALAREGK